MPRAKKVKNSEARDEAREDIMKAAQAEAERPAGGPLSALPDIADEPAGADEDTAPAGEAVVAGVPAGGEGTASGEEAADGDGAAEDQADEAAATPPHPDKKWYVVHTYSGYEGKVKANLEKRVESMLMQDKIFRVVVPTEDEIEYKDGRKLITKKKIFPGYVLVEMIMNDDSWYVVRNTPGVTGFVGSGVKPVALDAGEVKSILRHMGVDDPKPKVMYEDGESVKVVNGPFMGFIGKVREVNLDKGKLRVFVSMFGRETPVELDFGQIEKL